MPLPKPVLNPFGGSVGVNNTSPGVALDVTGAIKASSTVQAAGEILTAAAPTVSAGQVGLGSTTATSATAGSNGAVPAQVAGYIIANVGGTTVKIPYFNN